MAYWYSVSSHDRMRTIFWTLSFIPRAVLSRFQVDRENEASELVIARRLASAFVLYGLIAIGFVAVNMPPFQNPDEPAHFLRAAQLAEQNKVYFANVWATLPWFTPFDASPFAVVYVVKWPSRSALTPPLRVPAHTVPSRLRYTA